MSWELMSYGELMSGGTNVLDSYINMYSRTIYYCLPNMKQTLKWIFSVSMGFLLGAAKVLIDPNLWKIPDMVGLGLKIGTNCKILSVPATELAITVNQYKVLVFFHFYIQLTEWREKESMNFWASDQLFWYQSVFPLISHREQGTLGDSPVQRTPVI